MFKIKTGLNYLELLTPETMTLHGSNQLLDNQLFRYFTNFKY